MNRQLLPKLFKPNGAIYVMKIEEFITSGKLISKNTIPFKMYIEESIDIDSLEDLKRIKNLFKSIEEKNHNYYFNSLEHRFFAEQFKSIRSTKVL